MTMIQTIHRRSHHVIVCNRALDFNAGPAEPDTPRNIQIRENNVSDNMRNPNTPIQSRLAFWQAALPWADFVAFVP